MADKRWKVVRVPTEEPAAPPPQLAAAVAAKPGRRRRFSVTRKFLFYSILVHLLFAGGAAVWVVQSRRDAPKRMFISASSAPSASSRALEHKVQMKRHNAISAPVAAKRVTTLGMANFVMPPMPEMTSQLANVSPMTRAAGMGGAGLGATLGGSGAAAGFSKAGGTMFMASIGGLSIQARQLAVVLDISGSVAQYQEEMQAYVAKTFPGSEVGTFSLASFTNSHGRAGSIGTVILGFLKSPKKFDSIYVFSDFGETREGQDAWPEIQQLIREKKVRLYLHVLRAPGKEGRLNPTMLEMIAFAKSTGGNVKVGGMERM